jgi:hypothetical protein
MMCVLLVYLLFLRPKRSFNSRQYYENIPGIPLEYKYHFPRPVTDTLFLQSMPDNPLVLKKNQEYCDRHSIDYYVFSIPLSVFQIISHLFDSYPGIETVFLVNHPDIIVRSLDLSVRRLVRQSGDSALIFSFDGTSENIRNDVAVFRRAEITSYKLCAFYWHNSLFRATDPVYLDHPFPARTDFHRIGLPVFHYDVCVFHHDSILSPSSPFLRYVWDVDNHPSVPVYPWDPMPYDYTEIPSLYLRTPPLVTDRKIPLFLHQTMETTLTSNGVYHECFEPFLCLNPQYMYFFWDAEACQELIKNHFPDYVLRAYRLLLAGAYKADLFRYCVLYLYGGVYCDSAIKPLVPFNRFIREDMDLVVPRDLGDFGLWQGFMASTPKHEFLKRLIHTVCMDVLDQNYTGKLAITGPDKMGGELNRYLGYNQYILEQDHYLSEMNIQILCFNGKKYKTRPYIVDPKTNTRLMKHKIVDYDPYIDKRQKLLHRTRHYSDLFKSRNIFRPILLPLLYLPGTGYVYQNLSHRKIYSLSMIYDEISILEFRMKELWDVVDTFIIVEGDLNHSGRPKPFFITNALDKELKPYRSKLRVFAFHYPSNISKKQDNNWEYEHYHRKQCVLFLETLSPHELDIVLLSDLDEVPDAFVLKEIQSCMAIDHMVNMPIHWFNYGWDHYLGEWDHPISLLTWKNFHKWFLLSKWDGDKVSRSSRPTISIPYSKTTTFGWHVSYFLSDLEKITNKIHIQSTCEGRHLLDYTPEKVLREIRSGIAINTKEKIRSRPFHGRFPKHRLMLQDTVKT